MLKYDHDFRIYHPRTDVGRHRQARQGATHRLESHRRNMRWWIGHDSDGCTTLDYNHGPRVMMVKAENGWGCLEVLKLMLGGAIHKHADETESQQARKCWTISGRT